MALRLVEAGEPLAASHEIMVNKEEFLIGRGKDCDLQINESEISRHHCLLRGRNEQYTLLDLGSSNGTYLNGHRLVSQAVVQEGDEIRLGKHRFNVVIDAREGILWGAEDGVSASDRTYRIGKLKQEVEAAKQEMGQVENRHE